MDTLWLEDFLCVIEEGGFSRAAERRGITQPAFSRRIKALEDWVGARLFDRATHAVSLTPAGERFLTTAEETLRTLRQGREGARAAAQAAAETLRFASTHTLAATMFPRLLQQAGEEAAATVTLVADHMAACERLMSEGRVQFLLCHHHPAAPSTLPSGRFRRIKIGVDTLLPVAAPHLSGRPKLAFTREAGMGQILAAIQTAAGRAIESEPVFTSHLASVLTAMARDGRGIAWSPLSLVADDLATGRLVEVVEEGERVEIEIVVMRTVARQSPGAEAFWRQLRALYPQEP